jgi:nucleoside-diphosphate-sugar epimerase
VLALTRDYGHLTRLARLPQSRLRFAAADLTAPGGLDAHLAGVDTVIHCAFGNTGSTGERWQATVGGTRAVVQACLAAGVRRLVHVSSIAVHDLTSGEVITEDSRLLARDEDDRDYGQQKLAAEELVKAAAPAGADGLEVVVIRPTIIYGPYGPWWTRRPLEQLAENPAILPSGTAGSCNGACSPVYVDDVVSALLLAAGSADAAGEPFIIGGPAVVHWGEFFDRYRAMLSVPPHADETGSLPDWERGVYRDEAAVAISHAERVLGYKPAFGLGQGMAQAQAWAQWYGLV